MLLFLIAPCIDLCNNRPDHPFHAPQAIHRGNTNNYTIITSPAAPAERRGSAASASGSAAQLAPNLWHHVFSALPWWVKTTCCRIGFLRLCAACIDAVYIHRTYPGSVSVCLRVQLCEDMISTTLEKKSGERTTFTEVGNWNCHNFILNLETGWSCCNGVHCKGRTTTNYSRRWCRGGGGVTLVLEENMRVVYSVT